MIIVNYRSWQVLEQCLNSFDSYPPSISYEIIIVDNDSQDGHFEAFKNKFPNIKLIKNTGNFGFSHGCNLGANNASGEYLLFLNPDTYLIENNTLETLLIFAKSNKDVGITSCRRINAKGKAEREISFFNPWLTVGWLRSIYKLIHKQSLKKAFDNEHLVCYPDWVSGACVMINADFFNALGGWSEQDFWMYFEDPDLCLRSRNTDKTTALLRNCQIAHSHGGASRKNPMTVAITKSEVLTSCHVYINKHTRGFNQWCLHIFIALNATISQIIKTVFSAIFFRKNQLHCNGMTFIAIISYYTGALKRKTWKSKRIENHGA